MTRDDQSGVILVQVLGMVAFTSAIALTMISLQDLAITQSERESDDAQALALARGGEASAIAAFRRDGYEASEVDHFSEPWAAVAQDAVSIETGTFSLDLSDAQARYNLNRLVSGNLSERVFFERVVSAVGLTSSDAAEIADRVLVAGELSDLDDLGNLGIDPDIIAQLSTISCVLPGSDTKINLNTASEPLLDAILNSPGLSARLIGLRQRQGYITQRDLGVLKIIKPAETGLTSRFIWVDTVATTGRGRAQLRTLLQRDFKDGEVTVTPIQRQID